MTSTTRQSVLRVRGSQDDKTKAQLEKQRMIKNDSAVDTQHINTMDSQLAKDESSYAPMDQIKPPKCQLIMLNNFQ